MSAFRFFSCSAHLFRFIFWYHDSKMINYDGSDGGRGGGSGSGNGVSVHVRKSKGGLETTSSLTLRNAAPGDSGNYTCQPSNARSASIHVFVSEGEPRLLSGTALLSLSI